MKDALCNAQGVFFVKKSGRKTIYHNLIIIYPLDDIPVGMIGVERQGLFFYEVFIEPMRQGRGEFLSMEGVKGRDKNAFPMSRGEGFDYEKRKICEAEESIGKGRWLEEEAVYLPCLIFNPFGRERHFLTGNRKGK